MTKFVLLENLHRKDNYKFLMVSFVGLGTIFLLAFITATSIQGNVIPKTCRSAECLRSSERFLQTMNIEADPCEDFYEFACGHWSRHHSLNKLRPVNSWSAEENFKAMEKIRDLLETPVNVNDPNIMQKAKNLYKACMNEELLEHERFEPFKRLLKRLGLPELPHAEDDDSTANFNWLRSVSLIKKSLGADVLIGFDVVPDAYNSSPNSVRISTDNRAMNDIQYDYKVVNSYRKEIVKKYIKYSNVSAGVEGDEATLAQRIVDQAMNVSRRLKEIDVKVKSSPTNGDPDEYLFLSIAQLQNATDKLIAPRSLPIWKEYFNTIVTDVYKKFRLRNDNMLVYVTRGDLQRLQEIVRYVEKASKAELQAYIWLKVLATMAQHTIPEVYQLYADLTEQVLHSESLQSRAIFCSHTTTFDIIWIFSDLFIDDNFNSEQLPRLQRMLANVHQTFDSLVRENDWIDEKTRNEVLRKSRELNVLFGVPATLTNSTNLDIAYKSLQVTPTHFDNRVAMLGLKMIFKVLTLYKPTTMNTALVVPFVVNAGHGTMKHDVSLSSILMQYPFYNFGLEALNYGSIGAILGHEITHGFDGNGLMYDSKGHRRATWTRTFYKEFRKRSECFANHYNKFYMPDIKKYVNGNLTVNENIADHGGLRTAFYAYQRHRADIGEDHLRLPGLERYTPLQLFFISFGNFYCQSSTPMGSETLWRNKHAPNKFRVLGTLTNSEEFAETFKCRVGSGMRPDHQPKCQMW